MAICINDEHACHIDLVRVTVEQPHDSVSAAAARDGESPLYRWVIYRDFLST